MASPESIAAPSEALGEQRLVDALRAGDELTFARLVCEYGPGMLRVARNYVSTQAVAEEVEVQLLVALCRLEDCVYVIPAYDEEDIERALDRLHFDVGQRCFE